MKYRILMSAEVAAQILAASSFYDGVREGLGLELESEVETILNSIAANPRMYRQEFGPVRRALVNRFNQVIFYTIDPETVIILEFRDARREPPDWGARGIRMN